MLPCGPWLLGPTSLGCPGSPTWLAHSSTSRCSGAFVRIGKSAPSPVLFLSLARDCGDEHRASSASGLRGEGWDPLLGPPPWGPCSSAKPSLVPQHRGLHSTQWSLQPALGEGIVAWSVLPKIPGSRWGHPLGEGWASSSGRSAPSTLLPFPGEGTLGGTQSYLHQCLPGSGVPEAAGLGWVRGGVWSPGEENHPGQSLS